MQSAYSKLDKSLQLYDETGVLLIMPVYVLIK